MNFDRKPETKHVGLSFYDLLLYTTIMLVTLKLAGVIEWENWLLVLPVLMGLAGTVLTVASVSFGFVVAWAAARLWGGK